MEFDGTTVKCGFNFLDFWTEDDKSLLNNNALKIRGRTFKTIICFITLSACVIPIDEYIQNFMLLLKEITIIVS